MAQHTWAPGVLTASDLNTHIRDVLEGFATWQTYAAALTADATNPNLGSAGESEGRAARLGTTVVWSARFVAGGTGIAAGSGTYRVSLPWAARPGPPRGWGYVYGVAGVFPVTLGNDLAMAGGPTGLLTAAQGITTAGHGLWMAGMYEAAS